MITRSTAKPSWAAVWRAGIRSGAALMAAAIAREGD